MNFLDLANKRYSVRNYSDKPVEKKNIYKCIEAARLSPSACNSQPWHFVIIDDIDLKNKIAKETLIPLSDMNKFTLDAPVIVVLVIEKKNISSNIGSFFRNKDFSLIDIGIAAEHFCLQAAEEDLGTCMLGWFNEKIVKKLLKIPDSRHIGLLISLGYPKEENVKEKSRKPLDDICSFNEYKR
ncbi:MAG: nitroreductase family protein [Candidatus Delongbacteria bacterium]|nr:nitroreductase family protein [Candidatus Delongbacteria bacterium]MCG2759608.1 nitroreductase family protein [Candidatus Delongbacteria bacterium]